MALLWMGIYALDDTKKVRMTQIMKSYQFPLIR
jgi:hypothetical protein